jgi:hypothetical protein
MHVDERDEVALTAQQWRRQKPSSVAAARIYREDPPRITMPCN